jgi:hypothetical protein
MCPIAYPRSPGASHTFAEPALLNKIPLEPADLPVQKEVGLVN